MKLAALPLAAALLLSTGCPPPSQSVIAPTIATAVCILTTVSADVAAGDSWQQVVSDTIAKCGTDVATITTVWGAHEKALVQQGLVPPPILGRDGGP
jgi:hypothetical protein